MDVLMRTCKTDTMNVQRVLARTFVVVGGLFWVVMLFAARTQASYADFVYGTQEVFGQAVPSALIPLGITVAVFILSMFYETLTGWLLLAGGVGVLVWGVFEQWESVMWGTMFLLYAGPMFLTGALFLLAANNQRVCDAKKAALDEGASKVSA